MSKTLTSSHGSKPSQPVIPLPSPHLSSPFFIKKAKLQEGAKVGNEKVEQSRTTTLENTGKVKNLAEINSTETAKNQGETSVGEMKNGSGNHRPTNPFAKSSSNEEKSSLFDAIKKMKKTDETSKR